MNSESLTPASHDTVYVFEGYCLEPARRALTSPDGSGIALNCKPFDVLVYLLQHAGEVVDRAELLAAVWPRRVVEDNNVTQAIATLRRVLGARHIATVPGRGYQFVTPVARMAGESSAVESSEQADLVLPEEAPEPTLALPRAGRLPRLFAGIAAVALAGALLAGLLLEAEPEVALGALAAMTPLTTYAGEEATPDFSPDGTQVVFSWDGGIGNEDLYVTQLGTRAVARLTTSAVGADRYPAWSPNGQYIAFLRQLDATRFDVIMIPSIGGGQERKLYSGELDWISREGFPLLAWTPDSAQLFVTTRRGDSAGASAGDTHYGLHRIFLTTGAVEPVALGGASGDYDTSPAISPDGRWLAFTRFRSGERLNQVMVQALGAGFVPLGEPKAVAEAAIHHSLGWAPGSDRLWFVEGGRICEWRVRGTTRIAATAAQPSLGPVTFAHDGRHARAAVVTRRTDTDIFALPLDPVTHAALGSPVARVHSTASDSHPRFSPDGTQLAFVSGRSGHAAIWIAERDVPEPRQLTELTELVTGFPRWSPDGQQLAFHTSAPNQERVIYAISAAGGTPERLGNACCPGGWSADGKHVYVHQAGGTNRVMRLAVEDGSTQILFEGEMAVESVDGRYLLYAKSKERGYFRRSISPSSPPGIEERLVADYVPASGGLAAVADGFFYVGFTANDRPRAIRFYDYALGEARDVWPTPPSVAIGLTVSPDGRELLFAADSVEPNADLALLDFTPL